MDNNLNKSNKIKEFILKNNYQNKTMDDLLEKITDTKQRKQFHSTIINSINSDELSMMDYKRLFSKEYDYKTIINKFKNYLEVVKKEVPELQINNKSLTQSYMKVIKLSKYSKPFNNNDFLNKKREITNSKEITEIHLINQEHINYAKKYLKLEDEYISYSTMNNAITKILKGELTFQEIDKRKESQPKLSIKEAVKNAITNEITLEQIYYSEKIENISQNSIEKGDR